MGLKIQGIFKGAVRMGLLAAMESEVEELCGPKQDQAWLNKACRNTTQTWRLKNKV